MKLIKKLKYSGQLTLLSGLHIGGSDTSLGIGGLDKLVVRNPLTNEPYIPGSSLKGKLRSLLELKDGDVTEKGQITHNLNKRAGQLFGTASDKTGHPSRLIVRDAPLDLERTPKFPDTDLPFTEAKTEVSINRISAESNPRTIERVPAGAVFSVEMIINIFKAEKEAPEDVLRQALKDAIELLHNDYLGGHGSRGYGKVRIDIDLDNPEVISYE